MEEKEQESKPEGFVLTEVPTQLGIAIKSPEGKTMSMEEAIVSLLNGQRELTKAIVGK
jgi:hypothetical protein